LQRLEPGPQEQRGVAVRLDRDFQGRDHAQDLIARGQRELDVAVAAALTATGIARLTHHAAGSAIRGAVVAGRSIRAAGDAAVARVGRRFAARARIRRRGSSSSRAGIRRDERAAQVLQQKLSVGYCGPFTLPVRAILVRPAHSATPRA
jgi:hypothetical protein